jgi:hypothetical protein
MGANDNFAAGSRFAGAANVPVGEQTSGPTREEVHSKTILVAAIPASAEVIVEALSDVANLVVVHSMSRALHRLSFGIDLVVVGTYFDGARMFDLLQAIKHNPVNHDIPVICVRAIAAPTTPEAAVRQPIFTNQSVVDSACRALGAVAFLDLCEQPPVRSAAAAKASLARLARSCLESNAAAVRPA